jgi:hypothetical protein
MKRCHMTDPGTCDQSMHTSYDGCRLKWLRAWCMCHWFLYEHPWLSVFFSLSAIKFSKLMLMNGCEVDFTGSGLCLLLRFSWSKINIYEVYRKAPRLGEKRNTGITYSILAAISFKIVSLGTYTAIPSFFPCFKNTVEVIFLNVVKCRLRLSLDVRRCFKMSSLQFHFQFGKQSEIIGC